MTAATGSPVLPRSLGLGAAVLLGLGSILGTGVFVSLALAAGIAGAWALPAVALAALLAAANGLSSAQLAAVHPVAGGTYEYGYRFLSPSPGFAAGWLFLVAKSASAATAALGFAGYLCHGLGTASAGLQLALAEAAVGAFTLLVLLGIRASARLSGVLVAVTGGALLVFVATALPEAAAGAHRLTLGWTLGAEAPWASFLHATALLFVAYTGYARIATLGEEVREPHRTIPRAILLTLFATAALYAAVMAAALGAVGSVAFAATAAGPAAPLAQVAVALGHRWVAVVVGAGAMTAMLGVLLNLLLGLSRVLLAMGRRGDAPRGMAGLDAGGRSPRAAVLTMGAVVAGLVATGDVYATWSLSAFTVLLYYAVTHLAALWLPATERRVPRGVAVAGLGGCLGLAFWVEPAVWAGGLGILAVGFLLRAVVARRGARGTPDPQVRP